MVLLWHSNMLGSRGEGRWEWERCIGNRQHLTTITLHLMWHHLSLNMTGKKKLTRTGLPSFLPGVHLGMDFTTRKAS